MSDLTEGDFASRYEQSRIPTFVSATPAGGEETWQQREQLIGREIAAGPDKTVSGFVWNFNDGIVRDIEASMAAGDFASAKKSYDYACGMLDQNREDIISLSQIRDTGMLGDELAKRAGGVLVRDFNQRKVKLGDGSEVTIGQALSEGSPFVQNRAGDLVQLGLSEDAAQLYMGGDRALKSIMDPMVRSASGKDGADSVPNRLQLVELANGYVQDYDRINSIFEDGTRDFIDYVRETHKTSGNAAATMRSLVDLADAYSASTGIVGKQLANDVVGGYNDLLSAVFRGDEKRDERGVRFQPEISDVQRREFDAVLIPSIRETMSRVGSGFDMRDPRFRQSMLEVADVLAYTTSLGGSMFADARTAGSPINKMLGSYVADGMLGVEHRTDNIVESVRAMRGELSSRLVGGRDFAEVAYSLSGQAKDYMANVDKTNGTKSSSREADNLAAESHKFIAKSMLPKLSEGYGNNDAFADLLSRDQSKMVTGLASRLVKSFYGSGREELSSALSSAILSGFASGDRVCVEDLIGDLAFGSLSRGLSESAKRTAASWYYGNVAKALQFADRKAALYSDRIAQGFSDASARSQVAMVSEAAATSNNPFRVFDDAIDLGLMYRPVPAVGKDGKPVVVNGEPKYARVEKVVDNRNRVSLNYGKGVNAPAGSFRLNRAGWDAFQTMLAETYKKEKDAEAYRQKREIAASTAGSM